MSTPTDDRRDLLTVIASMRAKPGKEQEVREALSGLIERTVREEGCVNYNLHQGVEDPAIFYFYENWTGKAELEAHLQSPPLQALTARSDELLDGGLTVALLRRIA